MNRPSQLASRFLPLSSQLSRAFGSLSSSQPPDFRSGSAVSDSAVTRPNDRSQSTNQFDCGLGLAEPSSSERESMMGIPLVRYGPD